MKIFIITEGGQDIGMGHIARCISLYDAFKEWGVTPALILNDSMSRGLLKKREGKFFDWLKDKKKVFAMVQGCDMAIIDSYLAPLSFYEKISKSVKMPVYIDDNKRLDYPAGLVINGAIYADQLAYPKKKDITYLLGSRHISLREEFRKDFKKKIKNNIKSVMIAVGGDDIRNITPKILGYLNKNYPWLVKNVVIGPAFKALAVKEIEALKTVNVNLIYYPDADKMRDIMLKADIAISAGGQTLYELARIGVPTIGICIAENQISNLEGLRKAGFLKYIGWYNGKKIMDNLKTAINELKDAGIRQKAAEAGNRIVDGKGGARVVDALLSEWFKRSMSLRLADFNDASAVLGVANDDIVRRNSFNMGKIKHKEHIKWFKKKLDDKNCAFFIVEANNDFCGVVRFDIDPDKKDTVINISLKKGIRGLGLGGLVIKRSIAEVSRMRPNVETVMAYIKEGNLPSFRSFEKLGFKSAGSAIIKGNKAKVLTREVRNALGQGRR